MTQPSTTPEYILEEKSEKTLLSIVRLRDIDQILLDNAVDLEVLSRQLKELADMSTRIKEQLFVARALLELEH